MRKLSILIVLTLITIIVSGVSFGINDITVLVDGEKVEFDRQPYIKDGRTMVPIRFITEKMGCEVTWESDLQLVTIEKGYTRIFLQIGSTRVHANGEYIEIDVAPEIQIDRTMVPLRFISETLGANVEWDSISRTVTIKTIQSNDFIEPEINIVYPTHERDGFEFQVRIENWRHYGSDYEAKIEFTNYPLNEVDEPIFGPEGFGSAFETFRKDHWRSLTFGEVYSLRKYYTTKENMFALEKGMEFEFIVSIRNKATGEQRDYLGTAVYKDLLKDLRRSSE
ncbi:UNVERIFIED_CONTAM: copper amine oxidase-like protein [Acetivibrio alkalicellulosi]